MPASIIQKATLSLQLKNSKRHREFRFLLNRTDLTREDYSTEECAALFRETEEMYRHLKSSLLKAGTKNLLPVGLMVSLIDLMSDVRRIADQIEKGARYLTTLTTAMPEEDEGAPASTVA